MKLSREISNKFLGGCLSGFIIGIGGTFLISAIISNLVGIMRVDQIINYYYIGFGAITLGIILAAYFLSTIDKVIERVKSGKTTTD